MAAARRKRIRRETRRIRPLPIEEQPDFDCSFALFAEVEDEVEVKFLEVQTSDSNKEVANNLF